MNTENDDPSKPRFMALTPKEELAITVERLKLRRDKASNPEAKVRLDIACDLVRSAVHFIEQ